MLGEFGDPPFLSGGRFGSSLLEVVKDGDAEVPPGGL